MPYIDFKQLKTRVSIADILTHYGLLDALTETEQGYEGECPFCGHTSLKVNASKNTWFCFGTCKEEAQESETKNGGNMLDFVMRREGVDIKKAAALVNGWFPDPKRTQSKPKQQATPQGGEERAKAGKGGREASAPKPAKAAVKEQSKVPAAPAGNEAEQSGQDDGQGSDARDRTADRGEHLLGRKNKPLDFTLKSIDCTHESLDALEVSRETLQAFDVGYFTGKGMMHNKVVIPFHNEDGLLVAYVGYSLKDSVLTYPDRKHFDPRLELFNVMRVEHVGLYMDDVVLVSDLVNVLRLHDRGIRRVVALPTETLYEPQLALLQKLVGSGGRVHYVPSSREYGVNLERLAEHFHVRLHRYYGGSEDEFLDTVASQATMW